jgi:hypothetical protein
MDTGTDAVIANRPLLGSGRHGGKSHYEHRFHRCKIDDNIVIDGLGG